MYKKIEKMIKDLELRGRTPASINNRVLALKKFSKFYNQTPELLGDLQCIFYRIDLLRLGIMVS